ncbi:dynactin subunit 4 [Patella vulgata]|uniref:dynactin subunit 4 n=1 Tax=Patella vulgata TaxID=6465 RepID=UPI00217FCAB8|nr:dynactin subunit 4 [Patella vulgata]
MATYLDVKLVKYVCSCSKHLPVCRLYLCRHCLKLRCSDCVQHEVDTPYCPNCLENMPTSEAKLRKNRCGSCYDCPGCGHTLMTRASNLTLPDPEDATKTISKKMYYMACSFCRWTTRDVNIEDQSVASGAWQDQENEHAKRINNLLEYYRKLAQKEKAEKERKKYVKRRSHMYYTDKYGLTSVAAARKKTLSSISSLSVKDNEEAVSELEPGKKVVDFAPLPDDIFTKPLELSKMTCMEQRLSTPEFQPAKAQDMFPQHKHLLIRKSLRCKECEHNLSKPDFNPLSIKFKIQLIALNHIPEIRIGGPAVFLPNKETRAVLTLNNPQTFDTIVKLLAMDDESGLTTAKIELPKKEMILAKRNDLAGYDDNPVKQDFNDDSSSIAFRNLNKVGVFVKVTPEVEQGDVIVSLTMQHEYRNTTATVGTEDTEPPVVWIEQKVFIKLGTISREG